MIWTINYLMFYLMIAILSLETSLRSVGIHHIFLLVASCKTLISGGGFIWGSVSHNIKNKRQYQIVCQRECDIKGMLAKQGFFFYAAKSSSSKRE